MTKPTITILAAFMSASLFGSPAATRAWVTNYVNNAVSNVVVNQRNISVVSTDFESNGTNGYMVVTFGDGSVKRFPYVLEREAQDVKGLMVANSSISGLNNGTYYAWDYLDSEYRNVNLSRSELAVLKSSTYTSTNGVNTCEQLTATNAVSGSYFYTVLVSNVFVLSSIEYQEIQRRDSVIYMRSRGGTACLVPVTMGRSRAEMLGVTNFQSSAFTAYQFPEPKTFASCVESFAETLSSLLVPSAFADPAPAPSPTQVDIILKLDISLIDGVVKERKIPVSLTYDGYWHYWSPPDEDHVYVPDLWPILNDWNDYDNNWFHFTTGEFNIKYRLYLSVEDQQAERLSAEISSVISERTFFKKFCEPIGYDSPLKYLPPYSEPWIVEIKNVWECSEKGHNWGSGNDACVCGVCKTFRPHNLVGGDGYKCDKCSNHFGPENNPEIRVCGLTYRRGGSKDKSDVMCHGGWHDADGKVGNAELCKCECGDWELVHIADDEDMIEGGSWQPGMFDFQSGEVITTTSAKDKYHYTVMLCHRGRDDVKCDAPFYLNEEHDWDESQNAYFPVYRTSDGEPHVAYTAEQKSEYEGDAQTYMFDRRVHAKCPKCAKCGHTAKRPTYVPHNPTVGNQNCYCGECQHNDAHTDGYVDQCVNAKYNYWQSITAGRNKDFTPYCLNCRWQYELSKADAGRHSVDGEKGGYHGEPIGHIDTDMPAEKQSELHVCGCGLIEEEHYDDNGDRFCDVNCGYRFPYAGGNGKRDEEDDSESEIAFPENEESPDPQKDSPLPSPYGKPELSPGINTPEPPPSAPMPADIPSIDIDWGPTNAILVAVMRGDWYVADPDRKEETEALGTSAHPYVELVFQIYDNDGELLPGFVTIKYVFDFGMIGPLPSEMSRPSEPEEWEAEYLEGEEE